jgi:hypothetical protein
MPYLHSRHLDRLIEPMNVTGAVLPIHADRRPSNSRAAPDLRAPR